MTESGGVRAAQRCASQAQIHICSGRDGGRSDVRIARGTPGARRLSKRGPTHGRRRDKTGHTLRPLLAREAPATLQQRGSEVIVLFGHAERERDETRPARQTHSRRTPFYCAQCVRRDARRIPPAVRSVFIRSI